MRPADRAAIRLAYYYRCAYCGVSEIDVGAELTVDHFQPVSRGGTDDLSNWVYACHPCNEFKGDCWNPDGVERVLHPIRENLAEHFYEADDATLVGCTATGCFHIDKLRLNRTPLLLHRRERRLLELERQEARDLLSRLEELELHIEALTEQLEDLRRGEE